jgi:peptidoglycan/LPS O-acetylase OafA/YrhL
MWSNGSATVNTMKQQPVLLPLHALTGLRFIAAFLVVLHHFGKPPLPYFERYVRNVLEHGFVAVTLFFILSGFILTYSYMGLDARLRTSKRNFWIARFARIYPVYLVGFLLATPLALQGIREMSGSTVANTAWFATATLTLVQSWSSVASMVWNPPGWSLSDEAFFYLLFPFIAPLILKLSGRGLLVAMLIFWLLSLAGPLAGLVSAQFNHTFWSNNPLVRLPEFLMGIALGKLWLMRKPGAVDRYLPYIAVASAGLLLVILSLDVPESVFMNGTTAPLMMALIYSLASGRGLLGKALATKPMVTLGEASYSLYLFHWPMWFLMTDYLENHLQRFQHGPMHFVVCVVPMLVASLLTYKLLEQPANRFLKKALGGPSQGEPPPPADEDRVVKQFMRTPN